MGMLMPCKSVQQTPPVTTVQFAKIGPSICIQAVIGAKDTLPRGIALQADNSLSRNTVYLKTHQQHETTGEFS